MTDRITASGLRVAPALHALIETEIAPGTDVDTDRFWQALADIVRDLGPRNSRLLEERDRLQDALDGWHREHPGDIADAAAYRAFLTEIGYLVPGEGPVRASTTGVDPEIGTLAGPQLVVPVATAPSGPPPRRVLDRRRNAGCGGRRRRPPARSGSSTGGRSPRHDHRRARLEQRPGAR